ncbi:membrane protein insertion efficiency factor YidD [Candidatus Lariskella endosymbiont of Hedychridium roseum]|uniref:membrane protein insertion efficiency factor YidD n=1 Tax=Candidatus Lariskella endosymbiont of Hedychridium roseum TaxID=3077949 RepID=UPI003977B34A
MIINIYRILISPVLPKACRFYPSCSEYAVSALKKYNSSKAMHMIAVRIIRCSSFSKGGIDYP